MFPGGYFAKTFFTGTYFAPADGGSIIDDGDSLHYIGQQCNMGTMMGRR